MKKNLSFFVCFLFLSYFWGSKANALIFNAEMSPPFQYMEKGKVQGASIMVLEEIMRRAKLPIEKVEILPWIKAQKNAEKRKGYCAISGAKTPEREAQFKILAPLALNIWALYAGPKFAGKINSLEELKDGHFKVGGAQGDAKMAYLKARGIPESSFVIEKEDKVNAEKLSSGKLDFWAVGLFTAQDYIQQAHISNLRKVLEFKTIELYMLCNKKTPDDVAQKIMAAYESMKQDGTWDKLYKEGTMNSAYFQKSK